MSYNKCTNKFHAIAATHIVEEICSDLHTQFREPQFGHFWLDDLAGGFKKETLANIVVPWQDIHRGKVSTANIDYMVLEV